MVGLLESEREVAEWLASLINDTRLWASIEDGAASEPAEETALRAVEIYRGTAPLIEARLAVVDEETYDRAIGGLRMIADTCALRSASWTMEELAQLRIPTRGLIELFMRLYGVDRWAAALGHPLRLGEDHVPEEAWPTDAEPSELTADDLAGRFITAASAHDQVLELRESQQGRELLQSVAFRRAACVEISQGRAWLQWTRGHLSSALETVALGMWLISQASYVACRDPVPGEDLFPSHGFLRALLAKTDADEWLRERNLELPAWLTE